MVIWRGGSGEREREAHGRLGEREKHVCMGDWEIEVHACMQGRVRDRVRYAVHY